MSKKTNHKAKIQEIKGIAQPKHIQSLKLKRDKLPTVKELSKKLLTGDIAALSRAITLVESTNSEHIIMAARLLKACLPFANNSIRIGITGVPGVGKSTFIDTFGNFLIKQGKKVAVLAIDPSSSVHKGSILGDKTRMPLLVNNPEAFVRPSPTGESLGGVAKKTREAIMLCEAAGYNCILIETVGVGQSETAVHSMVDFFLLLKLAGAGDELQGIKRGIVEMADAIVINKADGANVEQAKLAKLEFSRALHLYPPKAHGWQPKVLTCSALNNKGLEDIWQLINHYISLTKKSEYFEEKRNEQNKFWLIETIHDHLKTAFFNKPLVKKELKIFLTKVANKEISPFEAANKLIQLSKYKNEP